MGIKTDSLDKQRGAAAVGRGILGHVMEQSRKGSTSATRERKPRDVSVKGGSQSTNISVIRPSRITGSVALPIRVDC